MMTQHQGLRVLQVTTDDDRRGGQVFATDLAVGLEQLGHDVRTVGLAPGDIGGLGLEALGPRRRHPRTIARLRETIRDADVVVGHGSTTLPACAIASAGTGVPFVYRQISDSLFWANTRVRRLRVRWAMSRATRIVALWEGAAATLTRHFGVPTARIDCIPNAVPVDRFPKADDAARSVARRRLQLGDKSPVVAYVGALAPEKGVDVAVTAALEFPDAVVVIAGDGPERVKLESLGAGSGGRVKFLGSVADPQVVYAAADVVVLPTRGGDSMPASLIEAGMTGRPVVATAIAAIPRIVNDGVTGIVVAVDDHDEFAAALHGLCDDHRLRDQMGTAAHAYCRENFSVPPIARRWSHTLSDAIWPIASLNKFGLFGPEMPARSRGDNTAC